MHSDQILNVIEQIAANPSKNAKQDILKEHLQAASNFKDVIVFALDPVSTYGIKKIPSQTKEGDCGFSNTTRSLLVSLQQRKLTGHAALAAVQDEMDKLTAASAELLKRVISKDLRAGFSASTVNKACKDTIKDFPYMRCSSFNREKLKKFNWTDGVFAQEKADAMFMNLNHDITGDVSLSSRQGSEYPIEKLSSLVNEVKATLKTNTQTHGELVVLRDGQRLPRELSNGIMNHVENGGDFADNEYPIFLVWDQIPLTNAVSKGKYNVGYADRFKELSSQLTVNTTHLQLIETKVLHSVEDAMLFYAEKLQENKEGIIIKDPAGMWADNTSTLQMKLKLEFDVELEVVGFEAGKGKNAKTFGSLICKSSDGNVIVSAAGFKEKPGKGVVTRDTIWAEKDSWIGKIVTVRANDIMYPKKEGEAHSLYLPRFIEERKDKSEADSLARIIEQKEAAMDSK